tara:strand:+ start:4082 stop:4651 length:570 start_codon:yes stop_codon:yes gene_type:complete
MSKDLTYASHLIDGKSVAVVGNCEKIIEKKDGSWIDEHDVVIRFNFQFPIPELSESLGNRTDIMICAMSLLRKTYKMQWLWNSIQRRHYKSLIMSTRRSKHVEYHLPVKAVKECKNLIYKEPTTGATTVHALMTIFHPASSTVFGFDGLKSRTWPCRPGGKKNSRFHRPELEQTWLQSIRNKITIVKYE